MKVKKYVGETIQDTIFKVKADLGTDAIILNTKKYKKGGFMGVFGKPQVEVLAALEEKQNHDHERTIQEINDLKNMVQTINERMEADAFAKNISENLAILYSHLTKQGVNVEFNKQLIVELQQQGIEHGLVMDNARDTIIDYIGSCSQIEVSEKRKVIAFVGPTGVGKTTTIAKLAAKFALEEKKKVGLITSDTYRIAAVQQLQTYSDIINIPLEVVYNEQELARALEADFLDYDLVMVDTAGSSWHDRMSLNRLKKIASHEFVDEVHLLISLNTKTVDIKSIVDQFSRLQPDKIVLTKLDETNSYGDIINIKEEYGLPFSYVTFGQDVPDDIQAARPEVLIKYLLGELYE